LGNQETVICEDFEGAEFYGSLLDLEITHFVRAESKFGDFGEFKRRIYLRDVERCTDLSRKNGNV
jgi:hypothetical protein